MAQIDPASAQYMEFLKEQEKIFSAAVSQIQQNAINFHKSNCNAQNNPFCETAFLYLFRKEFAKLLELNLLVSRLN